MIRYALAVLTGYVAVTRAIAGYRAWTLWHSLADDPSAADLYRTEFWFHCPVALLALGATVLLLRRRRA